MKDSLHTQFISFVHHRGVGNVAGVRNLTQIEAAERARILDVTAYDIVLDLTDGTGGPGDGTFRTTTQVEFICREPGATTFIEAAFASIHSATLNGKPIDTSGWTAESGLTLTNLAEENVLVVDADGIYSTAGQGLHRSMDPVDKEVYLYSQFETADAQKVFASFDQPDLKAVYTWHVTVPAHWSVISNSPVERTDAGAIEGTKTVHFGRSIRMSTYVTAVCAGPYHEVRKVHDGIDMGVYCRQSMKQYLDEDDIFLITEQGFDFFHEQFGVRYPMDKYDQLYVPEFNAGAMENFGCVVHGEQYYIFRSAVTDYEYENRANTILHEMAHMWFGDLVTMRWWDDLWLNESFAEWASHWANVNATRFDDAWTTFLSVRKNWGYRQDQLSSTHPVYCDMPDMEAVEVNFDGITYAKGASVIKQLVAYVGIESFVAGLRDYFGKHAWGNATFGDLLASLEAQTGKELHGFAAQWLETAQVNTLRPVVTKAADGTYASVVVQQEAAADYPTLRTHRLGVGLYDLTGGALVRRETVYVTVSGAATELTELAGRPAADVLLLNDEDHTYAKIRLDADSMAVVVDHIGEFDNGLARALAWSAAWDMVRDAELATRDYIALVCNGLPSETDINLITTTLNQARTAVSMYADPAWSPTGVAKLNALASAALAASAPGSGAQLVWARTVAGTSRTPEQIATLKGWLNGTGAPEGLAIDTEFRWLVLQCVVANGGAGEAEIEAALGDDRTATGERQAAIATALIPTAEAKEATWRRLTEGEPLPNWLQRALLNGFQHPAQVELTAPFVGRYFEVVDHIWATRDSEPAQELVEAAYPAFQVTDATVAATDAWLALDGKPAPLRRLIGEGRDGVLRARKARARDAA
jgi:aminopeptidase N